MIPLEQLAKIISVRNYCPSDTERAAIAEALRSPAQTKPDLKVLRDRMIAEYRERHKAAGGMAFADEMYVSGIDDAFRAIATLPPQDAPAQSKPMVHKAALDTSLDELERVLGEWRKCAEDLKKAEAENDEAYEIGKRDGYEEAIQNLDLATGGDGEFKGSTIPDETVDVPTMQQRIIERFKTVPQEDWVDPAVPPQQEPVAWRWRPKGSASWIYNPESQWLDEHRSEVECEPLYAAPVTPHESFDLATIEECAKVCDRRADDCVDALQRAATPDLKETWTDLANECRDNARAIRALKKRHSQEETAYRACPFCDGSTDHPGGPPGNGRCPVCGGAGEVPAAAVAPHDRKAPDVKRLLEDLLQADFDYEHAPYGKARSDAKAKLDAAKEVIYAAFAILNVTP